MQIELYLSHWMGWLRCQKCFCASCNWFPAKRYIFWPDLCVGLQISWPAKNAKFAALENGMERTDFHLPHWLFDLIPSSGKDKLWRGGAEIQVPATPLFYPLERTISCQFGFQKRAESGPGLRSFVPSKRLCSSEARKFAAELTCVWQFNL